MIYDMILGFTEEPQNLKEILANYEFKFSKVREPNKMFLVRTEIYKFF